MTDELLFNLKESGKRLNSYLDITQEQISDTIKEYREKEEKIKKCEEVFKELENASIDYKTNRTVLNVLRGKSDWEEIADWGCDAAKEARFTEEDSRALLKEIRDSLNNL